MASNDFGDRREYAARRLADMLAETAKPGWYGEVTLTAKIVNGRVEQIISRPEQHERFAGKN